MTDFKLYTDALNRQTNGISLLDWIKEEILKSPDKTIRIKIADIKRFLGSEFEKKDDRTIYDGLKFALTTSRPFWEKEAYIGVTTGKTIEKDKLIIMYYAHKSLWRLVSLINAESKYKTWKYRVMRRIENKLLTNINI